MNRALLIAAIAVISLVQAADAEELTGRASHLRSWVSEGSARLVSIETAAGTITVAPRIADRMKGFIADVVERGFKGRVKCYSWSKSHVRNSLHHTGEACDFAQHWTAHGLQTHRVMRHVADLTAKWGLRDGCSFRDCGHIDAGLTQKLRTALVRKASHRIATATLQR